MRWTARGSTKVLLRSRERLVVYFRAKCFSDFRIES
jgi:hypothetical protein